MDEYFNDAQLKGDRHYHIEYKRQDYDVICPEYLDKNDDAIIVNPYFLLPGRKYPIQVYLYAINIYVSNPNMSQRRAAEATRVAFGLETFSHSTLSRTFRALERSIVQEHKSKLPQTNTNKNRFPSINDTAERRDAIKTFLRTITDGKTDINEISRIIVHKWYVKYKKFLI